MKFLCNTEFFHSGVRLYSAGAVYSDITTQIAEQLIAMDKSKPLGALSFFTPVDEEAVNFFKGKNGKQPDQTDLDPSGDNQGGGGNTPPTAKPPTRAELVKEATDLGIQGAIRMKTEELKQAIEAARKEKQPDPPVNDPNATSQE